MTKTYLVLQITLYFSRNFRHTANEGQVRIKYTRECLVTVCVFPVMKLWGLVSPKENWERGRAVSFLGNINQIFGTVYYAGKKEKSQ
jgi:hypothetical protein